MFRIATISFLFVLLTFPLANASSELDRFITGMRNTQQRCREEYRLDGFRSYETCYKFTEFIILMSQADRDLGVYKKIRDDFGQLPRTGDWYVLKAEDCDDESDLRAILESRIRQLQDIRRRVRGNLNSAERIVAGWAMERTARGQLDSRYARNMSKFREREEAYHRKLRGLDVLLVDMRKTGVEDRCGAEALKEGLKGIGTAIEPLTR